jgi:hypothetical protein
MSKTTTSTTTEKEVVYIFTNPSFPEWIKIGRCSDVTKRLASLSNNTCLPFPFQCFYACEVPNAKETETTLHRIFDHCRISSRREFFQVDPEQVVVTLTLIPNAHQIKTLAKQIDTELGNSLAHELKRQSQFSFSHAKIDLGEKIHFTRMPSIFAIVVSDSTVEIFGEAMPLDRATSRCLKHYFDEDNSKIGSPRYWNYQGEMLIKRRARLHST